AGGTDEADHAVRRRLQVDARQGLQLAIGVADGAQGYAAARRIRRQRRDIDGLRFPSFGAHPGILAHSALLTKKVRKVEISSAEPPEHSWTRQSSSSDWASAYSSV